jgi:hypothetical protein
VLERVLFPVYVKPLQESQMASLYERAVQASFTPAPDGHVFRCPSPWLFGHWRSYLVNDAQKEMLAAHLRQRQRLILWVMAIYLTIALGFTLAFQSSGPPDTTRPGFFGVVALIMVVMLGLALTPHFYVMRKMGPLLAQLPRTDDRATLHEQLFGVAAVISKVHLAMGGVGGVLIAIANIKTIVEAFLDGSAGSQLIWSAFGLLIGVLMAAYFAYLAILKRRLMRKTK